MEGYIRLHRKIINWEWYTDIPVRVLFEHLLLTANWQDQKWRGIEIKRGQKLTSIQHLADETGLSTQQIRTALGKLESTQEITRRATNKNTLITIANYDLYQTDLKNQHAEQQTSNKRATTNKKDKKDKKEIYKSINQEKFYLIENNYEDIDNVYEN